LAKPSLKKIKSLTFILLILTSTIMFLSLLPRARAETMIISLTPSSGYVETTVQLIANISTVGGPYVVQFNEENITSGTAVENDVITSFIVPHAPEGVNNVTLIDTTTGENDTTTFEVLVSYSFEPIVPKSPAQLREGDSVPISINMTGGQSNYTYPNVIVYTPSGSLGYEAVKNITTTLTGDFYGNLTYPNDFSNGANTNFTGVYAILFNETVVSQFFVGLTDASEYHRGDNVHIFAVDYYPPNDNGTLTVKFGDEIIDSISWNATDGVINVAWLVPLNATLGDYNVSITPVPKSKENATDTQIFSVPGFKIGIFTLNLANKAVSGVFVKAYENSTQAYYENTSDANGLAILMLDTGNYSCEAFFKEVRVGETNFTVTNEEQVDFTCDLTTLNVNVMDEQNIRIPQVSINIYYNYTTNLEEVVTEVGTDSGETNITGMLQFHSLLPNRTCTIDASRYGEFFSEGNDTIYLSETEYVNVTIICPTRTLQVNILDARNQPIVNAIVNAKELMGGLSYSANTTSAGTAVLDCTLGKYTVNVYVGEILLNTTTIDLLQDQDTSIICELYGLEVSIEVVDYFGRPISNVNVTLQREGIAASSSQTQSDGTAKFSNVIGGDLQIAIYLPGQTQPFMTNNFFVDNSATIQIKMAKYVTLAGFLVEASQLATILIIVVALVLILVIEVYRRKHVKPEKSES
jgi:hypothetical protein